MMSYWNEIAIIAESLFKTSKRKAPHLRSFVALAEKEFLVPLRGMMYDGIRSRSATPARLVSRRLSNPPAHACVLSLPNKNARLRGHLFFGGEGGIRTPGRL
jgi:hypothetical protein